MCVLTDSLEPSEPTRADIWRTGILALLVPPLSLTAQLDCWGLRRPCRVCRWCGWAPVSEPAGWPGVSGTRRAPGSGCCHPARGGAAAGDLQSCHLELCWCGLHPGDCRTQEDVSAAQLKGPFCSELWSASAPITRTPSFEPHRCANQCWRRYVLGSFNVTQRVFVLYNKKKSRCSRLKTRM